MSELCIYLGCHKGIHVYWHVLEDPTLQEDLFDIFLEGFKSGDVLIYSYQSDIIQPFFIGECAVLERDLRQFLLSTIALVDSDIIKIEELFFSLEKFIQRESYSVEDETLAGLRNALPLLEKIEIEETILLDQRT